MINHARTLLLNIARSRTHYSDYGYEYIPPSYTPVTISSGLTTVRRVLFGAKPDNYFLNFRVNELLSYIHSTELSDYIYRLDPRVTYWPKIGAPYFEPAGKRITITQTYGAPQRLNVAGELNALTAIGKSLNFYTISLRRNEEEALTMTVRYEGKLNSNFTVSVTDLNAPPLVTLPDSNLNLRLNATSYKKEYSNVLTELSEYIVVEDYNLSADIAVSGERARFVDDVQVGLLAQWLVETRVNPAPLITTAIPTLELLGEPVFFDVFGVEDKEPYLTFKNLWFDHPLPAYRLGGMVLALIYRTEELRGKNG